MQVGSGTGKSVPQIFRDAGRGVCRKACLETLPIFAVNGKTYAEMNADEKNRLSHRALAIKSLIPILQKIINN